MPAKIVDSLRFESASDFLLEATRAAFLTAEFDCDSSALTAVQGAKRKAGSVSFVSDSDLNATGKMLHAGAVLFSDESDLLVFPQALFSPVPAAVTFTNDADLVVWMADPWPLAVAFISDSDLLLENLPVIPDITYPVDGQSWGTVNLVRNPSLEYADIGLADWREVEGLGGVTLTRDGATARDGEYAGLVTAPAATSGDPNASHGIAVKTQQGLARAGSAWAGSCGLWTADATEVWCWLRLVYTDGAETIGERIVLTTADSTLPISSWLPVSAPLVDQDPAKLVAYGELLVAVPSHAADLAFRVDTVQVEEAWSGAATPYADGDQGEGHRWTGIPGLSMSVRDTA